MQGNFSTDALTQKTHISLLRLSESMALQTAGFGH